MKIINIILPGLFIGAIVYGVVGFFNHQNDVENATYQCDLSCNSEWSAPNGGENAVKVCYSICAQLQ